MRQSRHNIEQELRKRICEGVYAPGSRLPLRRDLLEEFGASPLTLQRAMDRLAELGFIHAQGTRGTFVAERLPNRTCIALVFPDEVEALGNRFFRTIAQVGSTWPPGDGITFKPYFCSDLMLDVPEHRRLCADLADCGIAGIISVTSPHYLVGSPIFAASCPRVVIGNATPELMRSYRAGYIHLIEGEVHEAIFRAIRAAGGQRVSFLNHAAVDTSPWREQLRVHGMTTRPEWWLSIPANAAMCAQAIVRLLCSTPPPHRPDALIITDDNLVPYAVAGVLDAGLRSPGDIILVAHTNFPSPTHAVLPCLRYGVDVAGVLRAAAEEIVRLVGGARPRVREVPSVIGKNSNWGR